jgi:hypothetical protein
MSRRHAWTRTVTGVLRLVSATFAAPLSAQDDPAAARHPERGDGYRAALVDFACLATAVLSTDAIVTAMESHRCQNDCMRLRSHFRTS